LPGTTRLSLPDVLERLGQREINELWVEAGARLAGALLDESLADELILYMAPKLLGSNARPLADIAEVQQLRDARRLAIVETRQIGEDLRIRLRRAGDSAAHGTKAGG
jgi:diaminohydroxyphosphoribosylaminopyrimidine deaminase/5-amino-6-(5-phosphoribosylamino)uracil reductase